MLKIAMIAGEASGDMLASSLISALKQSYRGEVEFVGIGGRMMQEAGLTSWHKMETLSVMGYLEVIKSLPAILKIRKAVLKQLLEYKPDVFIGVDAPDFNFYIEHKLKQAGIKTVHYISPTIWAWRYERIYNIKKSTDLMLCIFPFEEEIYHSEGMHAKFIGHPMANEMPLDVDTPHFRELLSLPANKTIYTVLCGSRIREINNLAAILIQTCNNIFTAITDAYFVFPFANSATQKLFEKHLQQAQVKFPYQTLLNQTRNALSASDYVLAKSGTVSLETALCKKPMLICYKINKLTEWMVRRKIKIKYVGQPNIIAGREIIPEFLQEKANPLEMSEFMIRLHQDKSLRDKMISEFYQLHRQLRQDASVEGARAILELADIAC